jgi:beta-lactamase class A
MIQRPLMTIVVCTALTVSLIGGPPATAVAQAPDSTADEVSATPTPEPTDGAGSEDPGAPSDPAEPEPVPGETAPDGVAPEEGAAEEGLVEEAADDTAQEAQQLTAAAAATLPRAGRIGGADRYARAVNAAKAAFPSGATTVLVANGEATAAPVMAASLARPYDAPVLYTGARTMPSFVKAELQRLAPDRIVAVGGTSQITASLLAELRTVAPTEHLVMTSSYSGTNEALELAAPTTTAYFTGTLLDQAATLGSAAAAGGFSIMINGNGSGIQPATVDRLRAKGVTTIRVVGSTSSITTSYTASLTAAGFAVSRIDGADVYARALAAARQAPGTPRFYLANPAVLSDAALAGALGAVTAQPTVYTPYQCMLKDPHALISSRSASVVAVGRDPWLRSAAVSNISCDDEKPRLRAALESDIASVVNRYSGRYAVTVREITRAGEVGSNSLSATKVEPASVMKIFAAWAALKRVQDGRASLSTRLGNTSLSTCLKVMIHNSDNYCHTDIVHWIGISSINWMIADAGFSRTRYGSVPKGTSVLYAGNRTTTNDVTKFLQMLESGELLNDKYSDILLGHMRSQIGRTRIPEGLPPGVGQESKPGALWIASGLMQADSAIVHGPLATYSLSVIGFDAPSKAAIRAISRAVYSHFHGEFGSAASYPVKQMEAAVRAPLRSSPRGSILRYVSVGTQFEIGDSQRGWYQVHWGDHLLWMDFRHLRNRAAYR